MIKNLRIKFILYTMLSVFFLMAVILFTVNIINYSQVGASADKITDVLAANNGTFPGGGGIGGGQNNPGSSLGPETAYDTRYFTVTYTDGTVSAVNVDRIASIDKATAQSYAASVYSKSRGWYGDYRYLVSNKDTKTKLIIFIDYSRELAPSRVVLFTSLSVFAAGLAVSFVVVFFVSKRFVQPLEENNRKQKRFISDASHELKTPITIISANAEILEMQYGENESTKSIVKQVGRLSEMVKELNSLSRLNEEEKVAMVKFDLTSAFLDAASSFQEAFASSGKSLKIDAQKGLSYKGSEMMIRKLISILLDNALKYSLTQASISLRKEGTRFLIEERNDADGIKDGALDQVFERFYRSDEARGSSVEGSGIGLSIAKQIVSLHGGRIFAVGQKGEFIIKAEL